MEGDLRRKQIISLLEQASKPLSGSELAQMLEVSRQIIVQDIALLRASNRNIVSTNKGYLLYPDKTSKKRCQRLFSVLHDDSGMEKELYIIVDNGGRLLNVVVEHQVYGQIAVDLMLDNRRDVNEFIEKINSETTHPLSILTNGRHYHTIEADNEVILDRIEEEFRNNNFLVS